MYTITIRSEFSSAHNLRQYEGKCENLHGHNWKVEVTIAKEKLDKIGMVIDFKITKKHLADVLDLLDHTYLNDVPHFKKYNPTSENIAKFIYDNLAKTVDGLTKVTVWETDTSQATYSR